MGEEVWFVGVGEGVVRKQENKQDLCKHYW